MAKRSKLSPTAQRNIESIAQVEQQLLARHPLLLRMGDSIAHFFGSIGFIAVQVVAIGGWVLWNLPRDKVATIPIVASLSTLLRAHRVFDPYPFPLLDLVVSIEFLFLTTFVLMNQKHASRRNEHWAHLHLQLSMLTEQEVTKNLQLLDSICRHLGCHAAKHDPLLAELSKPIHMEAMVSELEKSRATVTDSVPTLNDVQAIEKGEPPPAAKK